MRKLRVLLLVLAAFACARPSGSSPPISSASAEPTKPNGSAPASETGQADVSSPAPASSVTRARRTWDFESDAESALPAGFSFGRTGRGREGRWTVRADGGEHVLAQLDTDDTNFRFPIAVANDPLLRDVRVSVRCKMLSGETDRACGLVARYANEDNYFVTRANALEDNIRLYTVREGQRSEIASFDGKVTPNTWHEYRFELRGDKLEVFWDGRRVIEHRDSTFAAAGRAGVWTKADSLTYFDDFAVEAL